MERAFPLEKKEYLQRYSSFPVSPGMTGKFLFHLQQSVCLQTQQGRRMSQRTQNLPVESIQINPKFLSSVDRGRLFTSSWLVRFGTANLFYIVNLVMSCVYEINRLDLQIYM